MAGPGQPRPVLAGHDLNAEPAVHPLSDAHAVHDVEDLVGRVALPKLPDGLVDLCMPVLVSDGEEAAVYAVNYQRQRECGEIESAPVSENMWSAT